MELIYALPGWVSLILITALCVACACGGHVLVRRSFAKTNFIEHNEVAGFIVAVVGVIYAVLLAFTTVVVWEHFSDADEQARQEVNAATDIWRFSRFLAPHDAQQIGKDLDGYAVAVANDEWPLMKSGRSSPVAQKLTIALMADIATIPATDRSRANIQNHLLDRVQVMADLRRRRINDNETIVLPVIKLALLFGAAIVIGFLYLFGLKNFRVQLLMTAATSGVIGLLLALVLLLDYPFRGDVSISPDRWFALHEIIAQSL